MPTATGDIREIVGQPVFVPLYRLFLTYGKVRRREVCCCCCFPSCCSRFWRCDLVRSRGVRKKGGGIREERVCERVRKKCERSEKKPTFFFLHSTSSHHLFQKKKKLASPPTKIFRLAFGPKVFIVVSDPELTKQILVTDAANYSKGLLSEILDFVMGQGLIPADGEVWRERRRAVVPALHRRYIESMLGMFGASALHGVAVLERQIGREGAAASSSSQHRGSDAAPPSSSSSSSTSSESSVVVEIENFFSRLTLDIIGKAVFNYDFDSLKNDDPFIQAVYTALREAEYRSTAFVPYWNFAPLRWLVRSIVFCFVFFVRGEKARNEEARALFLSPRCRFLLMGDRDGEWTPSGARALAGLRGGAK